MNNEKLVETLNEITRLINVIREEIIDTPVIDKQQLFESAEFVSKLDNLVGVSVPVVTPLNFRVANEQEEIVANVLGGTAMHGATPTDILVNGVRIDVKQSVQGESCYMNYNTYYNLKHNLVDAVLNIELESNKTTISKIVSWHLYGASKILRDFNDDSFFHTKFPHKGDVITYKTKNKDKEKGKYRNVYPCVMVAGEYVEIASRYQWDNIFIPYLVQNDLEINIVDDKIEYDESTVRKLGHIGIKLSNDYIRLN